MRRGYTREAYLDLVAHVRDVIPDVQFSGDLVRTFLAPLAKFELRLAASVTFYFTGS